MQDKFFAEVNKELQKVEYFFKGIKTKHLIAVQYIIIV